MQREFFINLPSSYSATRGNAMPISLFVKGTSWRHTRGHTRDGQSKTAEAAALIRSETSREDEPSESGPSWVAVRDPTYRTASRKAATDRR